MKKQSIVLFTDLKKTIKIMKIIVIMLFAFLPPTLANTYAQKTKISITVNNETLENVLRQIEKQTEFLFFYNSDGINKKERISINKKNATVYEVLNKIVDQTNLNYAIKDRHIVLTLKKEEKGNDSQTIPQPDPGKIIITGTIQDESGEPIIAASIYVKGTSNGTMSNIDGKYTITAFSPDEILVFSFMGFITQEYKIGDRTTFDIIMKEQENILKDVVVVGYGVQKKESLTGAIGNITYDQIEKTKAPSMAQAIQGKVAGLRIRQENGEPGKFSSNINVRGFGTPLFIIDGVIRDGSNEFQRLNPDDIESISFLKDATAAIYGMNSSNGAVIVTTKKGRIGKPKITLNANYGIVKTTDLPVMANAAQYQTMMNEASVNAGRPPLFTQEELAKWQSGAPGYESYDLYNEVFKKSAPQYQTTLSLEGGSEKISYFGSFGYAGENSLLKQDAITYDKYTFRSNVSLKITNDLTAAVNLGGRYDKRKAPNEWFYTIFKGTRVNPPTRNPYANGNPDYYNYFSHVISPLALVDKDYSGYADTDNTNVQTQFSLEYNVPFLDGLKLKGMFTYDFNDEKYKALKKAFDTYNYSPYTGEYIPNREVSSSFLQYNDNERRRLDLQFQATYNKTFLNHHNVGATYVFERREESNRYINTQRYYDFYTIDEMDFGREIDQKISGLSDDKAFLSHIGRFNYSYQGKYLAEFAFRYDGSYRYAPGKRWAFFPTASLGWRLSEESFIKNNFKFIDNLKIRASAGKSGEDAGDPFQFVEGYTLKNWRYAFEPGILMDGVASPALINENLTWVKTKMYNLGFDLSIYNGLFSAEFDVYQRDRNGLLADRYGSIPNTFGATLPQENLNSDRTRGIEFTLSHKNKIGEVEYGVSANFNFARTQNRYIERGPFTSSYDRWRNQSSGRWNDFIWGYQIDGRFTSEYDVNTYPIQNGDQGNNKELPGDFIIRDVNGDGIINDQDKTPLFWSGNPLIHYGFTIDVKWKNFDFYALFQGSANYTVQFDEVYAKMLCFKGGNTPAYFFDRWHREDPYDPNSAWVEGEWPAIRLEQDMGSFYTRDSEIWRKDASYLRLKSVEIGYTFNPKLLKKAGLGSLRVYVNGNNLFTFCDSFVKMFDPEKIEGDYSASLNYPLTKSYNIGFSVNF